MLALFCAMGLAACSPQEESVAQLADTYHRSLQQKEAELASLRSEVKALESRLAESAGRQRAMEDEVAALRGKSGPDPEALRALVREAVDSSLKTTLPAALATAIPSAPANLDRTQGQVSPPPATGQTPEGLRQRSSSGDQNVQRFDFTFPDQQ